MLQLTLICRLRDRLPLTASMEDDGGKYEKFKSKRKEILMNLSKKLKNNEVIPQCLTVSSGSHEFHILTENGLSYVTLCEKPYNADLAYQFLEDIKKLFISKYGDKIDGKTKSYQFIKFDHVIQRTRKQYCDTRTKRNLKAIEDDLSDVKQIMRKNFEEVVHRGEKLTTMTDMSQEILDAAKNMKKAATNLNRYYLWRTYGPAIIVILIVALILFARFYWFA